MCVRMCVTACGRERVGESGREKEGIGKENLGKSNNSEALNQVEMEAKASAEFLSSDSPALQTAASSLAVWARHPPLGWCQWPSKSPADRGEKP